MCVYNRLKIIGVCLFIGLSIDAFASELTITEAEQIALDNDFITKKYDAQSQSLKDRAIADGQLPDPQFSFGIAEIPLNNFNFNEHEDTEVRLGVSQAIPPGDTLKYYEQRTNLMAEVEQARMLNQRLLVLNNVRSAFIDLYYQKEAVRLLELNRDLFIEMADITERQYAEGRDNQHDVLRAQLELSLVEDKIEEAIGSLAIGTAELSKWIGSENGYRTLAATPPALPPIETSISIIDNLPFHPLLAIEDANVEAAGKTIAIAEEQYKPKWLIDFMVTENTASRYDLQTGPDFAGVFFKVSLPIFTDKRQDKKLSASKNEEQALRYNRSDRLRELKRQVNAEFANYARLERRLKLYEQRAIVEAAQTQEATFNAYQNDLADFETLIRARIITLNTQLEMLRIQEKFAKSHVNLLYLAGEKP